jgi:NAD(P)-dependent dehydrogenase (short-subunit alcohol dehydrogenase family)
MSTSTGASASGSSSSLKDRVVAVTGASSGIGAVLAQKLGQRGARVVVIARRPRELEEVARRAGAGAVAIAADVTRRDEVEGAVQQALARCGQIDVWINNAGRGISRAVAELSDADFDEMMLVNTKSALYGIQAVLPHFRERGRGHIINVSSMLGRVPFAPFRSAYVAAKHALNGLSACLRMELQASHSGILVSVVHPGVVATEFGVRALHGGIDSRQIPGAQSAEAVADVIAGVVEDPRADVYTQAGARDTVAAYYAADDMAAVEARLSFGPPPRRS